MRPKGGMHQVARKARSELTRLHREAVRLRRGMLQANGTVDINAAGPDGDGNYPPGAFSPSDGDAILLSTGGADPPLVVGTIAAALRRNTGQGTSTSSATLIGLLIVDKDTAGLYDASQQTRLTAPVPGWYLIVGSVTWNGNNTGTRQLGIRVNGNNRNSVRDGGLPGFNFDQTVSQLVYMDAGDYTQLVVNTTGAAPNINNAEFAMGRLF